MYESLRLHNAWLWSPEQDDSITKELSDVILNLEIIECAVQEREWVRGLCSYVVQEDMERT